MSKSIVLLLVLVFLTASCLIAFKPVSAASPNSWTSKAPMQVARSGLGVAVVNGKIYAIGGANSKGFLATNEEYDPATNTWASEAPMPTPRSAFGIAVYQNKIYCIGGYADGFSATGVNEVYDPATDTWKTKAPIPTPTLNLQANVVNSQIYLIGGSPNGTLNQVYDPANDTWLTKASIPTAVSSYASAVFDNKIYVITSNLNQIYDAETDSWSTGALPSLPTVFPSAAATSVFAPERIYLFGHSVDPKMPFWQLTTTQDFIAQSYDPKTDTWTVCSSVPTVRFDASAAVMNDKVYVIGGFNLEYPTDRFTLNALYTYSAVNEQYTPFGYGTVPPIIDVASPENRNYTSSEIALNFTVNRHAEWIGYSLDGKENVTATGNTTLTGLSAGLHNITVYAKDELGNTGASGTVIFSVAQESFPAVPVAAASVATIAVVGVGLLVYFVKFKKQQRQQLPSKQQKG